jgi:hypothetical protein
MVVLSIQPGMAWRLGENPRKGVTFVYYWQDLVTIPSAFPDGLRMYNSLKTINCYDQCIFTFLFRTKLPLIRILSLGTCGTMKR